MSDSLKNHCLVALANLAGDYFDGTVIYLLEHSEEGAFGLVVNRPLNLSLDQLFSPEQAANLAGVSHPVLEGGPVDQQKVFFLHQDSGSFEQSQAVSEDLYLTTSIDLLASVARGGPPKKLLTLLGYAGWGTGQLERELQENVWLVCPVVPRILFDTPYAERPAAAAALMGIDLNLILATPGHG